MALRSLYTCALIIQLTSYKQNKFNLLREQSEGYSKLLVEITSNLPPPHLPSTGRSPLSEAELSELATSTWEKAISIIGYFDLDPNRALDVILDILSVNIMTQYAFFLQLLRVSPWAPVESPSADAQDSSMSVDAEAPTSLYDGKSFGEVLRLAEGKQVLQPPERNGTCVLAQVLGFKFGYYQVRLHCNLLA